MKQYIAIMLGFAGMCGYGKAPYHLDSYQVQQAITNKQSKLLWHQWFPSVGLRQPAMEVPLFCPSSSLLTLHELAPRQGKGIKVAFIDTGVAAFQGNEGMPYHNDLKLNPEVLTWKTNIIGPTPLPTVSCYKSYLAYIAGHGTHTMGIVAAKGPFFVGFAPQATNFMIKACHDNGTTTVQNLIRALELAIFYKADIVNISLKINNGYLDQVTKKTIEALFLKIPYIVIPAGNESENILATLKGVTFSIGAFDYDVISKTCTLPNFVMYPTHKKPLLLAPGVDILSTGIAPDKIEGVYVVADGTSASAACITGFLALLLGEIGIDCDKDVIMRLIKESSFFLEDTPYWRNASAWGVIDMRKALWTVKNSNLQKQQRILVCSHSNKQ